MTIVEREVVEAPAVVPVTTRDVLHRAADLIEEFGWCQRDYGSKGEGRFCMVGAVNTASWDLGVEDSEGRQALYAQFAVEPRGSVTTWNDAPGRTKAEVVARLREAAEAAA